MAGHRQRRAWREGDRLRRTSNRRPRPGLRAGSASLSDLNGVRKAAHEGKRTRFTALLHHVTADSLRDSFHALKRDAAPGVDGITWKEYETELETRLANLHSRVHTGTYRVQPSKRAYIPKADGRLRPLGIAARSSSWAARRPDSESAHPARDAPTESILAGR